MMLQINKKLEEYMREFSKFRVITVGFILMFVFAIAAMYSNTKDIAAQKLKNNKNYENKVDDIVPPEQNIPDIKFDNASSNEFRPDTVELEKRIQILEETVGNISTNKSNSNNSLNCQIRGILDNEDVVPLSANESIEEAKLNNKEIVITCTVD